MIILLFPDRPDMPRKDARALADWHNAHDTQRLYQAVRLLGRSAPGSRSKRYGVEIIQLLPALAK